MINYDNIILDNVKRRLIYVMYIDPTINSFNDSVAYKVHLKTLKRIFSYRNAFSEVIFIITVDDFDNPLVKDLKYKISSLFINIKNFRIIVEKNDPYHREGKMFKKYVLGKLDDYDGITLFFHTKGLDNKWKDKFPFAWVLGQYFFNTISQKLYIHNFIKDDHKLLLGWPYIKNENQRQWLYAGACYWMKCQEISKYLQEHPQEFEDRLETRTLAEFYFLTRIEQSRADYPLSNIIKDDITLYGSYDINDNVSFVSYLQKTLPYDAYVEFINFYNSIVNDLDSDI